MRSWHFTFSFLLSWAVLCLICGIALNIIDRKKVIISLLQIKDIIPHTIDRMKVAISLLQIKDIILNIIDRKKLTISWSLQRYYFKHHRQKEAYHFMITSLSQRHYSTHHRLNEGNHQNLESTKGYSKSEVRKNNDKFGKRIGLNK